MAEMTSPLIGGEDFSHILEKVLGAVFFLGAAHDGSDWQSCCVLHSNRMIMDDRDMARGVAAQGALAAEFLTQGFEAS
jgi:hippurate hydrolase